MVFTAAQLNSMLYCFNSGGIGVDSRVTIEYHLLERWKMKFITVRDLRTTPAQVWKQLPGEQEIVITNNGKPIALLTPISDIDMEDTVTAVRRARAATALKKIRSVAIKNGLSELTMDDINAEIRDYRKSKKK
jgi:antitoxin (DNA-binding transcriptional repressor) of toxin-antitoxin stability system